MEYLIYLIIGLAYVLINVLVRKLDTDGDPFIVLFWWFLWPLCFTAIVVQALFWLFNKKETKE